MRVDSDIEEAIALVVCILLIAGMGAGTFFLVRWIINALG